MTAAPQTGPTPAASADFAALRARIEAEFERSALRIPEFKLAVLATADGRFLAGRFQEARDGARVSAIVSSLLAICETAGRELKAGKCESAVVKAQALNVVAIRLQALGRPLVLATAFGEALLLGAALRHSADLGERTVEAMRRAT